MEVNEKTTMPNEPQHSGVLLIDPVAMDVVNRIAPGCSVIGHHQFLGGILIQGSLGGKTQIVGNVILWAGGVLEGDIDIQGDLYVLGQIGRENMPADATVVRVQGVVYAGSSTLSVGTVYARRLQTFPGAQLLGPFMTLPENNTLPESDIQGRHSFSGIANLI